MEKQHSTSKVEDGVFDALLGVHFHSKFLFCTFNDPFPLLLNHIVLKSLI